jgi:predicted acyl esterase
LKYDFSMTDAPQFDRDRYREEIRRKLEGLEWQEQVVFAARCAWRAAPFLLSGWKDTVQRNKWLKQHLADLQAAAAATIAIAYGHRGWGRHAADVITNLANAAQAEASNEAKQQLVL